MFPEKTLYSLIKTNKQKNKKHTQKTKNQNQKTKNKKRGYGALESHRPWAEAIY